MFSDGQGDPAELQQALLRATGLEQFLHELAVLAARKVSDGLSCGMALRQRARPSSVSACSDPLASEADQLQFQSEEGPVLHALQHGRPALVDDTATDEQWTRFSRPAAALGIGSCYALPLLSEGEAVGALVLYARPPGAFGPQETARADAFAQHASGALTLALRQAACAEQNDQLQAHDTVRGWMRLMVTRMRGSWQASTGSPAPGEAWLSERSFRQADVPAVRRFAREFGVRAGVARARLSDLVLAVSEACACATAGGPCTARVRLWMRDNRVFCEARGDGMLLRRAPDGTGLTGAKPAGRQAEEEALRRLVLRQLADYVSVADGPSGIQVALSMTVA